jgi:hypothetical protein
LDTKVPERKKDTDAGSVISETESHNTSATGTSASKTKFKLSAGAAEFTPSFGSPPSLQQVRPLYKGRGKPHKGNMNPNCK